MIPDTLWSSQARLEKNYSTIEREDQEEEEEGCSCPKCHHDYTERARGAFQGHAIVLTYIYAAAPEASYIVLCFETV